MNRAILMELNFRAIPPAEISARIHRTACGDYRAVSGLLADDGGGSA